MYIKQAIIRGPFRYSLSRTWDVDLPRVLFLMLNPSTADARKNDPTVTRCENYAKRWGFGTLLIANLFALRATDPGELRGVTDPVGPFNDEYIMNLAKCSDSVVCAWGTHGEYMDRAKDVLFLLDLLDVQPMCLSTTASGEPGHPLYLSKTLEPFEYISLEG